MTNQKNGSDKTLHQESKTEEFVVCERCGVTTNIVYPNTQDDSCGEDITLNLCWNCDHDVMNGGDLFDDPADVSQARAENDYEYDPINTEPPW